MKESIHKLLSVILVAGLSVALFSCYPDQTASVSDLDIVITNYDSTFNFGSVNTYIMPDTVVDILGSGGGTGNHQYDDLILTQVSNQLNNLGWNRIYDTLTQKPDVAVMVNALSSTYSYSYYDWYDYWGWYGYWPPYYGGGYYYPWGSVSYSYTVGTILIQMSDYKLNTAKNDSIKFVWVAGINGVVQGSNVSSRITTDINQAFKQSPYL
jgi:hypothetical protein